MPENLPPTFRIAVIGSGVSGIAAASVLQRCGHEVTIYERSDKIGGVWSSTYPQTHLQNLGSQYRISGSPADSGMDGHPSAKQITAYLEQTIERYDLPVRTSHEVTNIDDRKGQGWQVTVTHDGETATNYFDKVIIAVGQYTQKRKRPDFPGEADFKGHIMSERDIEDFAELNGKRVAVVGFGKSALDVAALSAKSGAKVSHVFRQPRWMIPKHLFGIHFSHLLFSRQSTEMMTSWAHASSRARFVHNSLSFVVNGFWSFLTFVLNVNIKRRIRGISPEGRARIAKIRPEHSLLPDLRSASALEPDDYIALIASGEIEPYNGELEAFTADGLALGNGEHVDADVVLLALGSTAPVFPFLPREYREMLESEHDGVQLYRHLIHPRIPNMAFAGYNHGFMHIPAAEVGALWTDAVFSDRMNLPEVEEMEASIAHIQEWKRKHIHFEPSRSCAVNTRFHQYLDIVLQDLTLSRYRKMPNIFAEVLMRYTSDDYEDVVNEYRDIPIRTTFTPLPLDT